MHRMKRIGLTAAKVIAWSWTPLVSLVAVSVVWSADPAIADPNMTGIHLSIGAIGVLAGIVAIVGPAFWLLGKYDQRMTSTEAALLHLDKQLEGIVKQSISTGDRIAEAVEALSSDGLALTCPLEGCQHPMKRK